MVKSEFIRLSAELRKLYNVIFVFHTAREKNGDDVSYELVCEGAARTMVWQPTDLGAYLQIINGERFLGFTPTEQYNAKSAYGIKGLVRLPELKDGEKNTFLTGLFDAVRRNLDSESAAYVKDKERYDAAMAEGTKLLKSINTPDDIDNVSKALAAIDHALTSETELKQAIMRQLNGKGWTWDKKAKQWTKSERITRITPSLLSSWSWSFRREGGFDDFLKTLSREPMEPNEAMKDGMLFEQMVHDAVQGLPIPADHEWYEGILDASTILRGSAEQVRGSESSKPRGMNTCLWELPTTSRPG